METREAVLGRADGRMSGVTGNLIAQGGDSSAGSSVTFTNAAKGSRRDVWRGYPRRICHDATQT
jgi:hypothetical protein